MTLAMLALLLTPALAQPSPAELQVQRAFEQARTGNYRATSELWRMGARVAPLVAPYIKDPDPAMRSEAVAILRLVDSEDTIDMLGVALVDDWVDIQHRAARALYEKWHPEYAASHPALADKLAAVASSDNPTAAAILLLGYYRTGRVADVLHGLSSRGTTKVKLYNWSGIIGANVAAEVALAVHQNPAAIEALERRIAAGALVDLRFLLEALRELRSATLQRALQVTLTDTRVTMYRSHPGAGISRRLCDEAVDAFVTARRLSVVFPLSKLRIYTPQEIRQVQMLLGGPVARGPTNPGQDAGPQVVAARSSNHPIDEPESGSCRGKQPLIYPPLSLKFWWRGLSVCRLDTLSRSLPCGPLSRSCEVFTAHFTHRVIRPALPTLCRLWRGDG